MDCFRLPRRFGGQVVASLAMTQLAHEVRQPSTRGKSLRIFRSHVKPANQKYSAFVLAQISRITSPVSRRMRGARERHERAVRCGGR
jgi:nitrogen-specific signal transduction histidine kinase